jgi:hypothetical protein
MKLKEKYSRRALLRTLGMGAALLPLLNNEWAMAADGGAGDAGAGPGGFPKRLITITWTNGVYGSSKWTSQTGPLNASTIPSVMSPLAPYAAKMIIPRGVNLQAEYELNNYGGHFGYPCILTGTQTTGRSGGTGSGDSSIGPSIDTTIAATLNVPDAQLNLGCLPQGSYTSWGATGQPNSQITNPYTLFTKLFPSAGTSTSAFAALQARRGSVLDAVTTQLTKFQNIVGTDDKVKIQTHLDSIRSLELQLMSGGTAATCAPPALTQGVAFTSSGSNESINVFPQQVGYIMQLAALAVTCGIARCITIDLINDGGGDVLTFPFLTPAISSPQYHTLAHEGAAAAAQKTQIDTWWYQQVATLVSALDASNEGFSTSLDNSVVLVCNDMQEGNTHLSAGIPFVMVGSCGGFFKTGQFVGFKGVPNNQLLTSIMHAMGLKSVTGVGRAAFAGDLDAELT